MIKRQSSHLLGVHSVSIPKPLRVESSYAHSVSGGAGGYGTKISTANYSGSRLGSSFGGGLDYLSLHQSGSTSGSAAFGNDKITMQHLNDRLATYLETVRSLEKANKSLEIKIRETIEKRGPLEGKDHSRYDAVIAELRAKIFDMIKGNSHLAIAVDNARLASEDFKVKMEYEMGMRVTVEADVANLRKILDDTNVIRLNLETEIESLKEELITLKLYHEKDVAELHAQITQAGVHVDVDSPKGHDLAKIMDEMREKYERITLKNQEELKIWHESQLKEVQVEVTTNTAALKEATTVATETRRRYQALEIELQSVLSLKESLEAALRDIEMRNNMAVQKYNAIILRLQEELTKIRADTQDQSRDYEQLINIKVKLEAEIAQYRRLLDGELDFKLEDAVDSKKITTKVVMVTQTLVDGKLVAEHEDLKSSKEVEVPAN